MSFVYLASPYSDDRADVREKRYRQTCEKAARMMMQGIVVFAPIAHSHPIALFLPEQYLIHHAFWMHHDLPMLEKASKLAVLTLEGWDKSKGVAAEIQHARDHGIYVEYHDMAGLTYP